MRLILTRSDYRVSNGALTLALCCNLHWPLSDLLNNTCMNCWAGLAGVFCYLVVCEANSYSINRQNPQKKKRLFLKASPFTLSHLLSQLTHTLVTALCSLMKDPKTWQLSPPVLNSMWVMPHRLEILEQLQRKLEIYWHGHHGAEESNASNGGMHAHVNLLSDKEAL